LFVSPCPWGVKPTNSFRAGLQTRAIWRYELLACSEGKSMVTLLIAIRDFLLAAALAWVGVTLEAQTRQPDQPCAQQACEAARDR
jgi:hypothetical protein